MGPLLVADIGGTNARFGLVVRPGHAGGKFSLENQRQYLCADYPDFDSVLTTYTDSLNGTKPANACIAVAGPVKSDQVSMTNLDWRISGTETARRFGLGRLDIVNDYTALGYATLYLDENSVSTICTGKAIPGAPRCIVGPGTGLGVSGMAPCNAHWVTISGEGGHVSLASVGSYESRILQHISPETGVVSAETVLSGPGIRRLYAAICELDGYEDLAATPEEITAAGLAGADQAASSTFSVFCRLLGGMVGDLVLIYGAEGGVFLAGGILPRIESLLKASDFEECMRSKGVMSHYLDNIEVSLITSGNATLIGAAAWAERHPHST